MHVPIDRAVAFERPAGTWRVALAISIGLWGLIATGFVQWLGH